MLIRTWLLCGSILMTFSSLGCRSIPDLDQEWEQQHAFWVDARGHLAKRLRAEDAFLQLRFRRAESVSVPEAEAEGTIDEIIKGLKAFQKSGNRRVMIFIHGGLNSQRNILERLEETRKRLPEDVYPIFLNWDSSLLTSYFHERLFQTRAGREVGLFWGASTAPFVFTGDLARGVAQAPRSFLREVGSVLSAFGDASEKIPGLNYGLKQLRKVPVIRNSSVVNRPESVKAREQGEELLCETTQRGKKRIAMGMHSDKVEWGAAVGWALGMPVRMLVSPMVQGSGSSAWRIMKRRTRLMFNTEGEFTGKCHNDEGCEQQSVLLQLLEEVRRLQCGADSDCKKPTLDVALVSHSLGAIVANHMLRIGLEREAGGLMIPEFDKIVYMASAGSLRDYLDSAIPYAMNHPSFRKDGGIYHLTLQAQAEERERHPSPYLDFVPSGSLLVWVDDFYEDPETLMDWTAGRFLNLMHTERYVPEAIRPIIHYKVFPNFDVGSRDEDERVPKMHGDFTERNFLSPDFWDPNVQDGQSYYSCNRARSGDDDTRP